MALKTHGSIASGGWHQIREVFNDIATPQTLSRENSRLNDKIEDEVEWIKDERQSKSKSSPKLDLAEPAVEVEEDLYDFDADSEDQEYTPAEFTEMTDVELNTIKKPTLATTFEADYPFEVPPRPVLPSSGDHYGILPVLSTSGHFLAKIDLPIVEFKRRCTPKDRRACHMVYVLKNTAGFQIPAGDTDV